MRTAKKSIRTTIYVDEDLHTRLRHWCINNKDSVSNVVEGAMIKFLEDQKQLKRESE